MNALATLLILPGMDGSGTLYTGFTEQWAQRWPVQVIAYPPDQVMGYAELVDFVQTRLPDTGQLVLLGESFSGPISIALTARLPQRVIGLVLCCSFCRTPNPALRLLPLRWLPMFRWPALQVLKWVLGRHATAALVAELRRALLPLQAAVLRCRLLALAHVDARETLQSLRVPILYLQASSDRLVLPSAGDEVMQNTKHARMQTIDGAHFLLQTAPDACAAAIDAFIADLEPTPILIPRHD